LTTTRKQIKELISLTNRLRQQKFPVLVIVFIVVLSFLMNNCWGQKEFLSATSGKCRVLKIYDGDTITLQCPDTSEKTRVRLYCIDTPEIRQKPWGIQARDYLRSITDKTVQLVKIDKDRYGRIVGEVYSGKVNLNMAQVQAGQAAVYDAYCKKPEYKVAEQQAKNAGLGIWSQQGLHQTPWKWRKRK